MSSYSSSLEKTARLLRGPVTQHAVWGVLIASGAVVGATLLLAGMRYGGVSLSGIIAAQSSNPAVWVLDAMPFLFAIWGQYMGTMMAYQAGAMVLDETRDLRAQTSALEYQLKHGGARLLDLPDENDFQRYVDDALGSAEKRLSLVAVLSVDFDQFNEIRHHLGRVEREELIKQLGSRLEGALRGEDLVGHIDNDEFAVLLTGLERRTDVGSVADRIHRVLQAPVAIHGQRLVVRPGIGVAVAPQDGESAASLVHYSAVARQSGRERGREIVFYSSDITEPAPSRMQMVADLREVLEQNVLDLVYQPQIDAGSEEIAVLRASLSWTSVNGQVTDQETVLSLADHGGFVQELTAWQLNNVCDHLRSWQEESGRRFRVSLRLADAAVTDRGLAERIKGVLGSHDVAPDRVILEVTEDAFALDRDAAIATLTALRVEGIGISLAELGGRRASMAALLGFDFDEARLTPDLVAHDTEAAGMLLAGLVDTTAGMGVRPIVPGVANKRIHEMLASTRAARLEGTYIQAPLTASELSGWLALQDVRQHTG